MQIRFAEPDEEQQMLGANAPCVAEVRPVPAATGASVEFGHFRISLRERRLLADGLPVKLGTRAFDVLMVLVEAEGALVTKAELLRRVWPGICVSEDNLKMQISKLREALADGDLIRTEFGRGYRFTGVVRRGPIEVTEFYPSAEATGKAPGADGAAPMDLEEIASRLTSLETKLAAVLQVLTPEPRIAREFPRQSGRADFTRRRRRSRRRAEPRFTTSERPGKMPDWIAGG